MKKLTPYLIPLSLLVIALSIFSLGYESKMGSEPMMGATTKIKLTDPNSVTPAATSTPTANMIPIASSSGKLADSWLNSYILTKIVTNTISTITTNNSAAEITLLSVVIPSSTLENNGIIKARIYLSDYDLQNAGSITFKFKYGGTTLVTLGHTGEADYSNSVGYLDFTLMATTTAGQIGYGSYQVTMTAASQYRYFYQGYGVSAEDSTVSKILAITATNYGAAAATGLTTHSYIVELIK